MESRQAAEVVQGLFGDLQLSHTHDHDDEFEISNCNILPHKDGKATPGLIDELAAGTQSSFLPTIDFSSEDLRSKHHCSLRSSQRSSSELGMRFSAQLSARARESKSPICDRHSSSPRTTARSMEECISSLRGVAGKLKQLFKGKWLRSSQSERSL